MKQAMTARWAIAVLMFACAPRSASAAPLQLFMTPDEEIKAVFAVYEQFSRSLERNVRALLTAASVISGKTPAEVIKLYDQLAAMRNTRIDLDGAAMLAYGAAVSGKPTEQLQTLQAVITGRSNSLPRQAAATVAAAWAISNKPLDQIEFLQFSIQMAPSVPGPTSSALLTLAAAHSGKPFKAVRQRFLQFYMADEMGDEAEAAFLAAATEMSGLESRDIFVYHSTIHGLPSRGLDKEGRAILVYAAALSHQRNELGEQIGRRLINPSQTIDRGSGETAEKFFNLNWNGAAP